MARPSEGGIALPNSRWYQSMNKYFAKEIYEPIIKKEIENSEELSKWLGIYKCHFIKWAALQRINYEADIVEEIKEYMLLSWVQRAKYIGWQAIRNRIIRRDGHICYYCHQVAMQIEIDHKMPISKGGGFEDSNLVVACRKCNRQKRNKTEEEFLIWKGTTNANR